MARIDSLTISSASGQVHIGNHLPFVLIAGPCVLESRDHALMMSSRLKSLTEQLGIGFIYKTSFDKANRTAASSERGLGLEACLRIFDEIRQDIGCPVLTDVHEKEQCALLAPHVDVLQIPAFLCRQTDLLLAAAATDCVINVKKGQFLAPWDMKNVVRKLESGGSTKTMVCERGASFGYNTLVSDFRSLPILARECECPVVFDATHSVQRPGGQGASSGGDREFVPVLARAAVSIGVAALFMETHEDPDTAPSDGPNMVNLEDLPALIGLLQRLDQIAKAEPVL